MNHREGPSAIIAALLVAFAVASCGGGLQPAGVHGLLLWPASSQGFVSTGPQPTAGTVQFVRGSRVVLAVLVGKTGQFSVSLPAGTYVLKGASGPIGICGPSRPVHLAAAQSISLDVDCRYKAGAEPK